MVSFFFVCVCEKNKTMVPTFSSFFFFSFSNALVVCRGVGWSSSLESIEMEKKKNCLNRV